MSAPGPQQLDWQKRGTESDPQISKQQRRPRLQLMTLAAQQLRAGRGPVGS